ncbi:MAG: hypothetical protein ABWX92_16045 [Mycetocola sp.]
MWSADGASQEAVWERELPMRFNLPSGWPAPGQEWVMEHIGLPVTAYRRPPGAPPSDPAAWEWWIPQEPQWTTWMTSKRQFYRSLTLGLGISFVGSVAVAFVIGSDGILLALIWAMASGFGLLATSVQWAQFRRDPMSAIREKYVGNQE